MSNEAQVLMRHRWRKFAIAALAAATLLTTAACTGGPSSNASTSNQNASTSNQKVTLKFSQWWEPEMPKGALPGLINQFEKENPNIKVDLLSAPFPTVQTQTLAEAASGTLPDVVGLDGSWVDPLVKQGALLDLSTVMKSSGYNADQLASQLKINGKTVMIPVVNFAHVLVTNDALMKQGGIAKVPTNWSGFVADANAMSKIDPQTKGWFLPLSTTEPNGAQSDILSWLWGSGGSMLKNGQPNLTNNAKMTAAVNMVKELYQDQAITPGADALQSSVKVENFINGRVGMITDTLAHITTIRQGAPDLKFTVSAMPTQDGFAGKPGTLVDSWGIGINSKSPYPQQSWKLVQFLLSKSVNSKLSTLANGFPGNKNSTPDFTGTDPEYQAGFKIYQKTTPVNEFNGLPAANQLMTDFLTEFQKLANGQETTKQMLQNTQTLWKQKF